MDKENNTQNSTDNACYTLLCNVIVFEVDSKDYRPISIPFENEKEADSFIQTMKIGMYYKSIRPDLKLVSMKIVNVA